MRLSQGERVASEGGTPYRPCLKGRASNDSDLRLLQTQSSSRELWTHPALDPSLGTWWLGDT